MATAQQYRISPSDHDNPSAETAAPGPAPGNDNAEAKAVEALVRSKERIWHVFVRMLLLSGLLAGLGTAVIVLYIYA